jgi:hypothetical protein
MNLFRSIAAPSLPAPAGSGDPPAVAAADDPPRPSRDVVGLCYLIVLIGGILAWRVNHELAPSPPAVPEGLSVLVLLYVLAQVIERVLEPAVRLTVPDKKVKDRDAAVAVAASDPQNDGKAKIAANAQRDVDAERATVSVAVWAAATFLGMMLSAVSGAYLLTALGVNGLGDKPWIDIVVTGLAVGAGTKPVHDLISRIDAAKNAAKDPPETK